MHLQQEVWPTESALRSLQSPSLCTMLQCDTHWTERNPDSWRNQGKNHTDAYRFVHLHSFWSLCLKWTSVTARKGKGNTHTGHENHPNVSFSQTQIMLFSPSGPGTSEELNVTCCRHQYFPLLTQENETQILFFARGAHGSLVLSCLCLQANWRWLSNSYGKVSL